MPYAAVDCFGVGTTPVRNGGSRSTLAPATIVGSNGRLSIKNGLRCYHQATAVQGEYLSLGTDVSIKSVPFTYLLVASVPVTSIITTLIFGSAHSPSTSQVQFRVNTSAHLQMLKSSVAGIGEGTHVVPQDRPFTCAISYDGTNAAYYLNGFLDVTASSAQTFSGTNAFCLGGGKITTDGETNPCDIGLFVMWPQVLSQTLLCQLTANPWQLYAGSSRRIISQAAAAGGFKPYWASQRSRVIGGGVI